MDLQLYARVLWRFRILVGAGVVLACALATLSFATVEFDGGPKLKPRQSEVWGSEATLLVTERGFPLGRSVTQVYNFTTDPETGREIAEPRFASEGRFSELAAVYAQLAMSDRVLALMLRDGPLLGGVEAEAVRTSDRRTLPLVQLTATASSPEAAVQLAKRNVAAFLDFLEREQTANKIAAEDRVVVSVVESPQAAALLIPRKLTQPIVVFMTILMGVFGLAFLLHNLRPVPTIQPARIVEDAPDAIAHVGERKSA
jgi:hypothetical protein